MPHKDPVKRRSYQKGYQKAWRIKNKMLWSEILRRSDKKRVHTPKRKLTLSQVRMRVLHRHKTKALELYGKNCNFCGESKYEVLCIDHINNDGGVHRAAPEFKKFSNMWAYLFKTEFRPDLYQVLCWNCNMAKQLYKISPTEKSYQPFDYWVSISKKKNDR